jgi:hypothetical protein
VQSQQHTTQQPKVIRKRSRSRGGKILANSAAQEQDEHHRGRNPERPVQVRVPLEHVQEIGAREQRRPAAAQHSRGVDVEELRVEGEGPEEALGRGAPSG